MIVSNEIFVPTLSVEQPIGKFYLGVISAKDLIDISTVDMRRIGEGLDKYIGIQRKLSNERVAEIAKFARSVDATFPTSVILAIRGECAEEVENGRGLRLFSGIDEENGNPIPMNQIASILDGQHRVEGLRESGKLDFNIPVSIFVDADIADQAYVFSIVNLAQTKVNKSLVYDLLDYSKSRSPQKTAHDLAVAFDNFEKSPFHQNIKRLGAATPGREKETLTQATVVSMILPLLSKDPETDRDLSARGKKLHLSENWYRETPLRSLWINGRDADIAALLIDYFSAAKRRWPNAWQSRERGNILPRTNGFRALMRVFKDIYWHVNVIPPSGDNWLIKEDQFLKYFNKSDLLDDDFNSQKFAPGTSGETALYRKLKGDLEI